MSPGLLATTPEAVAADCVTYTCYEVGVSLTGDGSGIWQTTDAYGVPNNKIHCQQVDGLYTPTSVCHWTYEDYLNNGYIVIHYMFEPAPGSQICDPTCRTEREDFTRTMYGNTDFFQEFLPITYNVKVFPSGAGTGTVTSTPAGISCPGNCGSIFGWQTNVLLTAVPGFGSTFAGWTERCAGQDATCTFQTTSSGTIGVAFGIASYVLTVTKSGSGTGGVFSTPSAISCGATCSASLEYGTSVLLTAIADPGSTFSGWTGACTGQPADCLIGMIAKTNTAAVFTSSSSSAPPGPSNGPTTAPGGTAGPAPTGAATSDSSSSPGGTSLPGTTAGAGSTGSTSLTPSEPPLVTAGSPADPPPVGLAILGAGLLIVIGIGIVGFGIRRQRRAE
jgi:hypothetical protein